MMKILLLSAVLLLALNWTYGRRLSDQLDNEINRAPNEVTFGRRIVDWVRILQSPPSVVTRPAGTYIEIECEAVGSPAPTVQWLKDNTPLNDDASFDNNLINEKVYRGLAKVRARLVIHAALHIHEGVFTCVAESGTQVASSETRVYVTRNANAERNFTQLLAEELLPARNAPRIVLYDTIYMDNIGSDIVLPCRGVGSPRPSIVWLDPSEEIIDNDPRLTVLPDGELRIRNIRWNDMGPYTCVARNSLGQDNVTTFLYPMLVG